MSDTRQEQSQSVQDTFPKVPMWYNWIRTFGTNVVLIPIDFVRTLLISRVVGPEGKGTFDLMMATAQMLSMALGLAINQGVTYVTANRRSHFGSLLRQFMTFIFFQAIVATGILIAISHTRYGNAFLPKNLGPMVIVPIVVCFFFLQTFIFCQATLMGRQEIVRVNNLELLRQSLFVTFLLIFFGIMALGYRASRGTMIWGLVWYGTLMTGVTALLFFLPLRKFLGQKGPSGFRDALTYSIPCYMANFVQYINASLDFFLISHFLGVSKLGLYSLAISMARLVQLISNAAGAVLFPKVASTFEKGGDSVSHTVRMCRVALWSSLVIGIGLSIVVPPLLPLVYGKAFRHSITPMLLLMPGMVAYTITKVTNAFYLGSGRPRINFFVSISSLCIAVVTNLLLIPRYGILGAAAASSITNIMSGAVSLTIFFFITRTNPLDALIPKAADVETAKKIFSELLKRK